LRIRRHPCRVVGDGSNRDQLVCKSHVNIAHSPGTEASAVSRSASHSLHLFLSLSLSFSLSFSLTSSRYVFPVVPAALVRSYPAPSPSAPHPPVSSAEPEKRGERKQSRDKVSEAVTKFLLLRLPPPVRFRALIEAEGSSAGPFTDIWIFEMPRVAGVARYATTREPPMHLR